MNKSLAFAAASLAVSATATAAPNDNAGSARRPTFKSDGKPCPWSDEL